MKEWSVHTHLSMSTIIEWCPMLWWQVNHILSAIKRKKSMDTIILSLVASVCTFLIFIYWLTKWVWKGTGICGGLCCKWERESVTNFSFNFSLMNQLYFKWFISQMIRCMKNKINGFSYFSVYCLSDHSLWVCILISHFQQNETWCHRLSM